MVFYATLSNETMTKLGEIAESINSSHRLLLVSHLRPDGDATGSCLGLARALRLAGKQADIALHDPIPERFRFLLGEDVILRPDQIENDYDTVLVLDSGDAERTGLQDIIEKLASLVVNIDHHASNTEFGDLNLVDTGASSTCEMVTFLIERAYLPLDSDVAEPLYLGLLTDSRFFQNETLRSTAHHIAARLLETGLTTSRVLQNLNATRSMAELKILGLGLMKMQSECEGQLTSVIITRDELQSCGATLENVWACGLFNQILSVQGTTVGLGVVEGFDGKTYCEFRSRNQFNVKDIAVAMGGGGHLAASGCSRAAPVMDLAQEALILLRQKLVNYVPPALEATAIP